MFDRQIKAGESVAGDHQIRFMHLRSLQCEDISHRSVHFALVDAADMFPDAAGLQGAKISGIEFDIGLLFKAFQRRGGSERQRSKLGGTLAHRACCHQTEQCSGKQ